MDKICLTSYLVRVQNLGWGQAVLWLEYELAYKEMWQ